MGLVSEGDTDPRGDVPGACAGGGGDGVGRVEPRQAVRVPGGGGRGSDRDHPRPDHGHLDRAGRLPAGSVFAVISPVIKRLSKTGRTVEIGSGDVEFDQKGVSVMSDGQGAGTAPGSAGRVGRDGLVGELAAVSRRRWAHLSDAEFARLQQDADDPRVWDAPLEDGFVEPVIGWSVVFPQGGTLAELSFRDEAAARRAAAGIPDAVVSSFSTPDASWHRWEDRV